jgi:hypothetical protein
LRQRLRTALQRRDRLQIAEQEHHERVRLGREKERAEGRIDIEVRGDRRGDAPEDIARGHGD